jgi:hypothetical protein
MCLFYDLPPTSISVACARLYVALGRDIIVCHLDGFVTHTISVPFWINRMVACDDWVAVSSAGFQPPSLLFFDHLGCRFPSPPIPYHRVDNIVMCLNEFVPPPLRRKNSRTLWTPRHVEVDTCLQIVHQFSDDLIDVVLSYVGHGLMFLCSFDDNELLQLE